MKRISEALAFQTVLAPQSVAASTDKTTAYVDVSGVEEIVFLVSAAALGKGKGLTVSLLASGDSGGDGAEEIGKTTFTDSVGTAPQLAVVTYKVSALNGRYVAVKLRHDAAAEVVCGVTAASSGLYMPAANGWTLAVSEARRASLLAYCRIEEPTAEELLTLEGLYDAAVGYLEQAGVSEPEEGTPRRAQYDLCVNFMVLRDFDLREATITGTIVNDNPAFRRLLTQLKLTEPDVSNLDTSGGGEV